MERLNRFFLEASLRGLGIGNWENDRLTGERWFIEKDLSFLLRGLEQPILFDVGANLGTYSLNFLREFPGGESHAFEPHPQTFSCLAKNLADQPANPIPLALGDKAGDAILFDYKSESGGSSHASLHEDVFSNVYKQETKQLAIKSTTLDAYCDHNGIERIDLLKIDTEGNEHNVLRGASQMIGNGRISIVQIEFNVHNLYSGCQFDKLQATLPDHRFYRLLPTGRLALSQSAPFERNIFLFQNLIAIPSKMEASRA